MIAIIHSMRIQKRSSTYHLVVIAIIFIDPGVIILSCIVGDGIKHLKIDDLITRCSKSFVYYMVDPGIVLVSSRMRLPK